MATVSGKSPAGSFVRFMSFLALFLLYCLTLIGDGVLWMLKLPISMFSIVGHIVVAIICFPIPYLRNISKRIQEKFPSSKLKPLSQANKKQQQKPFWIPVFFQPLHIWAARMNKLKHTASSPLSIQEETKRFSKQQSFQKERQKMASKSGFHFRSFLSGAFFTIIAIIIPYVVYSSLRSLPNPTLLTRRDLEVSTKIYDRNGILLYEIYADQNRTPLPLSQIPDVVKKATIAIEDREFYRHMGFSLRGITRALWKNVNHTSFQGGSTITQQLIKTALLSPEVTITRKMKEVILAFWAERLYSKDQILEMYLNQVPYGGTAWGIEAAAQTYLGKSIKDVTLAEAALLAGLPAAPTDYSPFGSHPERAFTRQAEVLRRMVEDRYITKEQAEKAIKENITFTQPRVSIRAPHFVMYIRDLLEKEFGPRLVDKGGLRVVTSLDLSLQEKVQEIVSENIDELSALQVGNGAALVTDPRNGQILAMVGSRDYFNAQRDGNVNVTTALRQPGSSIKVVTYSLALENGMSAATILDDSPVVYTQVGSPAYIPVNYDGKFHGPTPLRYALANSYNIPAVKLIAKFGVPTMIATAKKMGVTSWIDPSHYGLSLTLGGGEVTMLEMAEVFGTLANNGTHVVLDPIVEVSDYTGKVYKTGPSMRTNQALKPETAWIIGNILADNQARTPAFGPNSELVIPGKTVSVKTGTSNDKRDNWTIGYTPSFVTTVWVGNNDNSPMNPFLASGVTGAAPIWHDIMTTLLENKKDEVALRPESIVSIPCYFNKNEFFAPGTLPVGGKCAPIPTQTPSPTPKSQ